MDFAEKLWDAKADLFLSPIVEERLSAFAVRTFDSPMAAAFTGCAACFFVRLLINDFLCTDMVATSFPRLSAAYCLERFPLARLP